jgi:plastocyanin
MRFRTALALALVAPLAAAAQPAKTAKVAIQNFAFSPRVITVSAGTTITWTNGDDDLHTVVAIDHSFHSAALDSGDAFSHTFVKPGTYPYFCTLHPEMTGEVVVKPSGG